MVNKQRAVTVVLHMQRVIHIFGADAVDSDKIKRSQIFPLQVGIM
ncbi:Uncharacterised protein [Yersinia enterocolitica]|nr:Uncharacterised protein [Yersinia enterocolitica]